MEEDVQFEKALTRLEKIVSDLESGELPLDDALKRYEEGVKLSRSCSRHLDGAEKKIEVLTRTLNTAPGSDTNGGNPGEAAPAKKKKPRKTEKPRAPEANDDFLI